MINDGYDYVRDYYGVNPVIGQRVRIDGKPGTIVRGVNDQYIYVELDSANLGTGYTVRAHPTWRVDYEYGETLASYPRWMRIAIDWVGKVKFKLFKKKPQRFTVEYTVDHVVDGQEFYRYTITDTLTGKIYPSNQSYANGFWEVPDAHARSRAKKHIQYLENSQ